MAGNFTPAGIEYLVKNFSEGMSKLGKLDKAQQGLGNSAGRAAKQFTGFGKGILSVGAVAGGAALAGVTALGVGVGVLGAVSGKTAISFESAFAGVLKTTDGLTDAVGNLNIAGTELRAGFVGLSKEVPLAFEELAAIGELGGQLGIGKDALVEFTESVAALGVSTNLSTEEAASGLAKIGNIFNVSADKMGENITRLGSTIVDLGNNFATTERDILNFGNRLAGAGAIAGLSQSDILGIGTAMSSVGVEAEAGGTAVQKVLLSINEAALNSTEDLAKFAEVSGLSADEFKKKWETDAAGAFQLFVEGLGRQGDNAVGTLDELGLKDQRLIKAFLSLAGAGDLLGNALDTANSAFEENSALSEEAAKRYATTESQLLILKNTFRAIGDSIGSRFLPILNKIITAGKDLVNKWADPIAQAIDEKVIPAIEGVIKLGSELFAAFQSGGTGGLVDALGLTPETTELISKISQSVQELGTAIVSFFLPGLQQLSGGGILDAINTAIVFLNENFEAFRGAIIGIGAVLAGAAIAATLAGIATAITTILSPIGLLIIAAGALGAAWATNWMGIREITANVIATITGIVMALVQTFQSAVLPPLMAAFDNLTQILTSLGLNWGDVWNAILEAIKIVAIGIGIAIGLIVTVIAGLATGIATALEVATRFVDDFGIAFTAIFTGLVTTISGVVDFFQAIIAGDWAAAWASFGQILLGVQTLFLGVFDLMSTTIEALLSTSLAFIVGFAQGVIEIFTNLSNVLVGNSIIPDMVMRIVETFQMMIQPILDTFNRLSEGISNILGSLFAGAGGGGEGFNLDLTVLTQTLPQAIAENVTLIQGMISALGGLMDSLGNPIQSAMKKFKEAMVSGFSLVFSQLDSIVKTITLMITKLLPALSLATMDATSEMEDALNKVASMFASIASQITSAGAAMTILNSAIVKFESNLGSTVSKVNSLISRLDKLESQTEKAADAFDSFENARDRVGEVQTVLSGILSTLQEITRTAVEAASAISDIGQPTEADRSFGAVSSIGSAAGNISTVNNTSSTTQIFNISLAAEAGMSDAQTALMIKQSIQQQLSTA